MEVQDLFILILVVIIVYVLVFKRKESLVNKYEGLVNRPYLTEFLNASYNLQGAGGQQQEKIYKLIESVKKEIEDVQNPGLIIQLQNLQTMTTKEFDDLNKSVLNSEINKEIDDVKESGLVKCAVCISYTPIGLTFCDDPYHSLCFSCFLQHVRRHIAVYEGGNEKIRAAKQFDIKCPHCNRGVFLPQLIRNLEFLETNKASIQSFEQMLKFNGLSPYSLDAAKNINPQYIQSLKSINTIQNENKTKQYIANLDIHKTHSVLKQIQQRKKDVQELMPGDYKSYTTKLLNLNNGIEENKGEQRAEEAKEEQKQQPREEQKQQPREEQKQQPREEQKQQIMQFDYRRLQNNDLQGQLMQMQQNVRQNYPFLEESKDPYRYGYDFTDANQQFQRSVDPGSNLMKQDSQTIYKLKMMLNKSLQKINSTFAGLYYAQQGFREQAPSLQERQNAAFILQQMNKIMSDLYSIKARRYSIVEKRMSRQIVRPVNPQFTNDDEVRLKTVINQIA